MVKVINHYKGNEYRIEDKDGNWSKVNLKRISWQKIDSNEQVNLVMVPRKRWKDKDVMDAKQDELDKLKTWDTYELIPDEDQQAISTRWVVWEKDQNTVRARLVARGFEEKIDVPVDSPTISKDNLRIMFVIIQSMNWELQSTDVKSAFLQGRELEREVLLKPPAELEASGFLMKLRTPLYGLNDASLQWYLRVKEVLTKDLDCIQSIIDPALYMKYDEHGNLCGLVGTHVDDFLHAGTKDFEKTVIEKLKTIFDMGSIQKKQFKYVGFELKQDEKGLKVSQEEYANKMEKVEVPVELRKDTDTSVGENEAKLLRQAAGRIGWLAGGTRPDLCITRLLLSTKFKSGKVKDLILAEKSMNKIKSKECFYTIPKGMGPVKNWSIKLFTDASLGNLENHGSTQSFIALLCGERNTCAPIAWNSSRISRIANNTLEAETLACSAAMDEAISIKDTLEEIFRLQRNSIPINVFVDSNSLDESLKSTTAVDNKRLRRDVARIKENLEKRFITSVSWVPSGEMLADAMTKQGVNTANMQVVLQSGKLQAF